MFESELAPPAPPVLGGFVVTEPVVATPLTVLPPVAALLVEFVKPPVLRTLV
jgi:hypothetical protein